MDIKETRDAFILHADVPGVDPKDIDVHMENGILTIKGDRESEKKDEREGYKRVERQYGAFYRRFSLPDTADAEKIAAKCKNGVLEITIPKKEAVTTAQDRCRRLGGRDMTRGETRDSATISLSRACPVFFTAYIFKE